MNKIAESSIPTPYAVTCRDHGLVYMCYEFYMDQLNSPNSRWLCPVCFNEASWSDANYDEYLEREMAELDMPGGFND